MDRASASLPEFFLEMLLFREKFTESSICKIIRILIAAVRFWSFGSIFSHIAGLPDSSMLMTGIEMLAGSLRLYLVGSL
jgi:hypothetical protein